ncbi:ALK-EXO [Plodia interpunctella granulovirus]|uniref:ALK-EXO n=1 Tax=Plodia interpunctella granulovirus TaxID=262175 RepID=A0A1L5JGR7_9BBAC|nr:ALK-EXO [Plodia interpunctella granulovirus]APO13994.1 ALK-EXO [Plodia interpunctella granulovirus]
MAYELAVDRGMTEEEMRLAKKYSFEYYSTRLTELHRNSKEEIMELERATRGQSENTLWKLIRINRTTATGNQSSICEGTPAMQYGLENEKKLKRNTVIMSIIRDAIEDKLKQKVAEEILECGLFLSDIGLFSASPDAYFVMEDGSLVVLEIKCPYTYRHETLDTIRQKFNNNRNRYRVPNTAFSVSRSNELNVVVEKRNDHYRQIQSQLYVTGAILAVYMVKFSDMPEVHFVKRDETYISELRERELVRLSMYARENVKSLKMVMEKERRKTFDDNESARALARDGLYYKCGLVVCYFCRQTFEIVDKTAAQVLAEHGPCDRTGNISMVEAVNASYLNIFDRLRNLQNSGLYNAVDCQALAQKGFYHDGRGLVTYCCGHEHKEGCRFLAM